MLQHCPRKEVILPTLLVGYQQFQCFLKFQVSVLMTVMEEVSKVLFLLVKVLVFTGEILFKGEREEQTMCSQNKQNFGPKMLQDK